jgi:hypothetical protein
VQLADVTEDEWKGIPEIGDYSIKRRKRFETFSAVSDSLLAGALATATGNVATADQTSGFSTDLTALGQGRKQMLGVNLDRMADSVAGQTTVDPTGYLTSLNSKTVRTMLTLYCSVVTASRTFSRFSGSKSFDSLSLHFHFSLLPWAMLGPALQRPIQA